MVGPAREATETNVPRFALPLFVRSTSDINTFRDLQIYLLAFRFQQELFQLSATWPRAETYALVDQLRRSSRAIGANVAEAWSKRRYPAHFLSKLTDADGELQETSHWLSTAAACGYLSPADFKRLSETCSQLGRMLGSMMAKHETFCLR